MVTLNKALREKREKIIKRWEDKVIAVYPEDTQRFLKKESDQFANPVGYTIKTEIRNLYDGFISQDKDKIDSSLTQIVKIRAIQDFSPSAALYFIWELKNIIKEETEWDSYNNEEKEELDKRISSLLLEAFDIYEQCRYKLYELRVNEVRNQVSGLLKMANLVYEIPEITSK